MDVENDHSVLYVCACSYNKQNVRESLGSRGQLRSAAVSYYIIVNRTREIQYAYAYRRCFVWEFRTRSYMFKWLRRMSSAREPMTVSLDTTCVIRNVKLANEYKKRYYRYVGHTHSPTKARKRRHTATILVWFARGSLLSVCNVGFWSAPLEASRFVRAFNGKTLFKMITRHTRYVPVSILLIVLKFRLQKNPSFDQ